MDIMMTLGMLGVVFFFIWGLIALVLFTVRLFDKGRLVAGTALTAFIITALAGISGFMNTHVS